MIQSVPRVWPADAVHDTVDAVVSGQAFRRSLQNSIGDRLLLWIGEGIAWLLHLIRGIHGGQTLAIWIAAFLVLLLVIRLLIAVEARDPNAPVRVGRRDRSLRADPSHRGAARPAGPQRRRRRTMSPSIPHLAAGHRAEACVMFPHPPVR